MNILIIGPSWVGDMVMSQSLYKTLRQLHLGTNIDVLAPAWCRPILERMPEVRDAIDMPFGHGEINISGRWSLARQLKKANYTHAYVLPNSAKSALIPFFAGIPHRIGWKGEMRYGLLTDLRPRKTDFQYMVERYVALAFSKEAMLTEVKLGELPKPKLTLDKANQTACLHKFDLNNARPLVGICPGAEFGPAKRWPEQHYANVTQALIEKGHHLCLFGGTKDTEVTQRIRAQLTPEAQQYCTDLAGKTSLNDAVDLLGACHTVISNDSGLMHVAAAVGANIVAIYGSSSPRYTPPLSNKVQIVNTDIACRPCFKRTCPLEHLNCLTELSPVSVLSAFEQFTCLAPAPSINKDE